MQINGMDSKVAKYHSEWVKVVNTFGEYFYAEDIVQEVYIRLLTYSREEQCIVDGYSGNT